MNQIKTKIEETAAIANIKRERERVGERETVREGNNKTKIEN